MAKIINTNPNAAAQLNGISFELVDGAMRSVDHVEDPMLSMLQSIPGFLVHDDTITAAAPAQESIEDVPSTVETVEVAEVAPVSAGAAPQPEEPAAPQETANPDTATESATEPAPESTAAVTDEPTSKPSITTKKAPVAKK